MSDTKDKTPEEIAAEFAGERIGPECFGGSDYDDYRSPPANKLLPITVSNPVLPFEIQRAAAALAEVCASHNWTLSSIRIARGSALKVRDPMVCTIYTSTGPLRVETDL